MKPIKIATSAAKDVQEVTLRRAPGRLLRFLQAAGGNAEIATLLAPLGWNDERMQEAWALLSALGAASRGRAMATPEPPPMESAIAACEAFQSTLLVCARAMLSMTHPEQAAFLFDPFKSTKGAASLFQVASLLERFESLVTGRERHASKKDDQEALRVLARVGMTGQAMAALKRTVLDGQSRSAPTLAAEVLEGERTNEARRLEALRRIYVWISTWSEMARTVVKRRDYQITLGLARPRPPKDNPANKSGVPSGGATEQDGDASEESEEAAPNSRAA